MILDIALGILSAIFTSWVFEAELTTKLILLGILFALLPDIDVVWGAFIKGNWWEKGVWGHREITHYPLLYVVLVPLVWLVFGKLWAFLLFLGVLLHILHDSFGDGWGVKWFWPFSNLGYEIRGLPYSVILKKWQQSDKQGTAKRVLFGNWLMERYFKKYFVIELAGLIIALIIFYLYAK